MRVGRVTVEILAPVPLAPLTVSARVVRPGRSVELLEASLARARTARSMRARGWRVAAGDIKADWSRTSPRPAADGAEALDFFPTGESVG